MKGTAELRRFLNAAVADGRVLESVDALEQALRDGRPKRIQTLNLHHLDLFQRNPSFREATRRAGAWTADGWPVELAFKRLGSGTGRVTGRELCGRLAYDPSFAPGTTRIALLGASEESGERFGELLAKTGRELVVREHGAIGDWWIEGLAGDVHARDASLVLVAVSPPDGELIADRVARLLTGRHCVVIGVGGAVDMATGLRKTAPAAVSTAGLEWLWRLGQEPRRMASRYLRDGVPAFARLAVAVSRR
jgi:N-acetylglucosaminyldiphosphoundecaprenol N-acetyl-beta-D-mannosaminyltransferase